MKVRKIKMQNFASYKSAEVSLPDTGLVLVTGANGAGKSSIIEAIAHSCWNASPRGAERAWVDGKASAVQIEADTVKVKRHRKNSGTPKLTWSPTGERGEKYSTNTEAQTALESTIGSFDVWRRTCVFSSADAAHFTTSTDKARKLLLEQMLGLGSFDAALKVCRADLASAKNTASALQHQHSLALAEVRLHEQRIADAQALDNGEPLPELEDLRDKVRGTNERLQALEREESEIQEEIAAMRSKLSAAEHRVEESVRRSRTVAEDKCPTCEQGISEAMRSACSEAGQAARNELQELKSELEQDVYDLEQDRSAIGTQRGNLTTLRAELIALGKSTKEAIERRAKTQQILEEANAAKQAAVVSADGLADKRAEADKQVSTLTSVGQVLGLKGPRSAVLSGALQGINAVASARLTQIAPDGYGVRLNSYTQTKSKTTNENISIEIQTPTKTGWQNYGAASSGQRRRVDVALVLGLAGISGSDGTLFFDEVFDALDKDGHSKVCALLQDLSTDRCVVVVSHSDQLVSELSPSLHLHCSTGTITAR